MRLFNIKGYCKMFTLVLCLAMVLALTACGTSSTDYTELLRQAQENAESVQSLHFDMKVDTKMLIDGEAIDSTTNVNADVTQEPMAGRIVTDMGELGTSETYFKENGETYDCYIGVDNGEGQVEWIKRQMDAADIQQYAVTDSVDELLKMQDYLKRTGTDKVNGKKAVRFEGVISGEDMISMVESSGAMSDLGVADIGELRDSVEGKDISMSISIWMDQETCMPVKYVMDMTELMDSLMSTLMASFTEETDADDAETTEDFSLTVEKFVISVELSQFNEIGEIEIPAEALEAQSLDDMLAGLDDWDWDLDEDLDLDWDALEDIEDAA